MTHRHTIAAALAALLAASPAAARAGSRPSAPEDLSVEATSEHAVELRWSPSRSELGVASYEVQREGVVVASVKRTRATEDSLRPGGSHCYMVRAFDVAGNASPAAGPVCALTPDLTPPSTPTALAVSAPGETEVELRWSASTDGGGVAGYEVLRGGRVVAGGPSPSSRERGLRPYTEYCYAVRAVDGAGNRSPPSEPGCVRTPDVTPPSVPQHLVASATSDRSVQVLWQGATDNVGVERYELLREGEVVAQAAGAWGEERDLRPGARYCYAVRAVDPAGNRSAASGTACAVTPDVTPPSVPGALAAQPVSPSAMYLAWEAATDDVAVSGYEIVRDHEVVAQVAASDALAADLAPGEHCFRVRAIDAAGNRSELSAASCATTADPSALPAPFRLQAQAASERAVRLAWEPSSQPGVVYRVYWDGGKSIGATRLTGFSAVGLKPGERHCFRVAAIDEQGRESPRSLEACAASRSQALTAR